MTVKPGDIRTRKNMGGGTLVRHRGLLHQRRPLPVPRRTARGHGDLGEQRHRQARRDRRVDGALLRFEGERVAAFVTSFNATDVASYRIVGTKGQIHVDPAYEYAEGLEYELTVEGKSTRKRIGKRDQFAPELLYFSDCIRKNREPEPSGEEGLQDVRIVEALYKSAKTGKAVRLPPFTKTKRPTRKAANHPAGGQETGAGQGRKRQRMTGAPGLPRRSAKSDSGSRPGHSSKAGA